MVFKGSYGDEPLKMFQTYDYAFDQKIQFTKSDFYISDVVVYDIGNIGTKILDVELVDLSFTEDSDVEMGFEVPIRGVEAVTYQRLEFNIGLNPTQNSGRPEDYPADDPLGVPRYWEPWTSYIFARTEGLLDTLGGDNPDMPWLYHTGTDELRTRISLEVDIQNPNNMTVPEDGTLTVEFTLDHRSLFGVPDDPLDIQANPINHNPTSEEYLGKLVSNYGKSLTFVVDTD